MSDRVGMPGGWTRRLAAPVALATVAAAALVLINLSASTADVTDVRGGAFGVSAPNITLFGGAQPTYGPTPTVTLPPGGSGVPVTGHDNSELAGFGPATLFESGAVDVSTQGTTGASGSVTSTSTISSIPKTGGEQFTADSLSATCSASETGTSGSTTVTNGVVDTHTNNTVMSTQAIPTTPAPNYTVNGDIVLSAADTETFTDIFNEQTVNPDGSITVTALHEVLHGPTAKGDVYVGQVVCGVTVMITTTTTSTTTSTSTTTTTVPGRGCARIQQSQARFNGQLDDVEARLGQRLTGSQLSAVIAKIEDSRARINGLFAAALARCQGARR